MYLERYPYSKFKRVSLLRKKRGIRVNDEKPEIVVRVKIMLP